MRLASFSAATGQTWGAVTDDGMIDLGDAFKEQGLATLKSVLEAGLLDAVARKIEEKGHRSYAIADIKFDPVIPEPGQILCIGLNYDEHRIESRRETTGFPTVFARFGRSQLGHREPILRPAESDMLDFEGELAIVIGSAGRRVDVRDALKLVAGYACYNDASVRDFQRHTSQFHPGKNFPATGAFGPWMVTADEIDDYSRLSIETRLNGATVQSASLDQLIFPIPELIAYCSTFTDLRPGDVIVTGTPGGVGSGRNPPLWMKHGDTVEVEISGVGLLTNPVADEPVPDRTPASEIART